VTRPKESPADYSLLDPAVQACPYHAYKVYREGPVFQMPETGHYVVSRYQDIWRIVREPEVFSIDTTQDGGHPYDNYSDIKRLFSERGWESRTVLSTDPPLHGSYRSLLEHCFTNRRIKSMQPMVEQLSNELIDAFIDKGKVEFVEEFCYPLPMMVIADFLGLPQQDLEDFKRWSIAWVAPFAMNNDSESAYRYALEHVELKAYLVEKFDEKRRKPDGRVISDLVNCSYTALDGTRRPLTENELLSITEQLLVGGNETTNNAMASAMLLLLQHPGQMDLLLSDIDRYVKGFVEECLRYESPTQGLYRYTVQDTTVGETFIPKGSMVHLRFAAGNRDDGQYSEADVFDITRSNAATHLAFSHGQHHCMGAPLSRMEMKVAFSVLLRRLKNIRLARGSDELKHVPGFTLRALEALDLAFDR